jgi:heme exporter protein B|tara:strand:+ start:787 stop:1461 length:675 start_codon:yes stop_codon:yes gene_type:complete
MKLFNSILAVIYREFKLTFRNSYDILSILIFFILGILIFVFSIGPNKELLSQLSIGIVWTLLILATNLTFKKFYQEDLNDGNIYLLHISGISYEIIVIIKLFCLWIFFQLPFLIMIPVAFLLFGNNFENIYLVMEIFIISSLILTTLASISGAMNLLNNKNIALGSSIIMIFSIPIIIFSVSAINSSVELIQPQINILLGILFLFLAITPWISAFCIKIAISNK